MKMLESRKVIKRKREKQISIAERVVKEHKVLILLKKAGSSIFWGGISVTTLSMILENIIGGQSITHTGILIRLGIAFTGLVLYSIGHILAKLWRKL